MLDIHHYVNSVCVFDLWVLCDMRYSVNLVTIRRLIHNYGELALIESYVCLT